MFGVVVVVGGGADVAVGIVGGLVLVVRRLRRRTCRRRSPEKAPGPSTFRWVLNFCSRSFILLHDISQASFKSLASK